MALSGPYKYNGIEASNIGLGQCGFDKIEEDGKTHYIGVDGTTAGNDVYHKDFTTWVYIRNITKPAGELIHIFNEEDGGGLGDPANYHQWIVTDPGDIEIELTSHLGDSVSIWLPQSGVIDGCFKSIEVKGTINPTGTHTATVIAYRG